MVTAWPILRQWFVIARPVKEGFGLGNVGTMVVDSRSPHRTMQLKRLRAEEVFEIRPLLPGFPESGEPPVGIIIEKAGRLYGKAAANPETQVRAGESVKRVWNFFVIAKSFQASADAPRLLRAGAGGEERLLIREVHQNAGHEKARAARRPGRRSGVDRMLVHQTPPSGNHVLFCVPGRHFQLGLQCHPGTRIRFSLKGAGSGFEEEKKAVVPWDNSGTVGHGPSDIGRYRVIRYRTEIK